MITLAAVWFFIGFIIIVGMLFLSILKQIKWKTFGISISIYLVVLLFMFIIAGSMPSSNNSKNSESSSESTSTAKIFKLVYIDDEYFDDEIHFETNKNGKYIVKVKGLRDGKIKLANENDAEKKFKTKTYKIRKGQILKIPIQLKDDDFVHEFEITDNNDNSKDFSVYNNSDNANSIMSSMDASESSERANESSSDDSYQASLDARKDNWNNSPDGETIHVSKVWQDGHTTFVEVNEDDWSSLSETDKDSFVSDWTNSIQDIYKMSDKNGTTSVQVVSSSNHDHMLAHGTGSGSVKIDD